MAAPEFLTADQVLTKTREYNIGVRNKATWSEGELFNLIKDVVAIRAALGLSYSGHSVLLGDKNLNFRLSSGSKDSADVTRKELVSELGTDPPVVTERLRINRVYEDTPIPHDRFEIEVFATCDLRGGLSRRFFRDFEKTSSSAKRTAWAKGIWRAHILDSGISTL